MCRLLQGRSICKRQGVRKLRSFKVARPDTAHKGSRRGQLGIRVTNGRQDPDRLSNLLGHQPDGFHQVTIVGNNGRYVKIVPEGVKKQMAGEIDVAAFLLGLEHAHDVGPRFVKGAPWAFLH